MSRGFDSATAAGLGRRQITLATLKRMSDAGLRKLGLSPLQVAGVRAGARPPIPFANLLGVLNSNKFMCCVCRDIERAVIVHHIREWSKTHDHSASNLAVLCLLHHDRAHTTSTLTQNLTPKALKGFKQAWEQEVRQVDARAILAASRIDLSAWWYFNHVRLFELARELRVRPSSLEAYAAALDEGVIHKSGETRARSDALRYMYSGGAGMTLYAYVRELMHGVLSRTAILNISDSLDRRWLSAVLSRNDFVFVQGAFYFSSRSKQEVGRDQRREGVRRANHVRIDFTFDLWEATSNSAHSVWLSGRQSAACVGRVSKIEHRSGHLCVTLSVYGICSALEGLKQRDYAQSAHSIATQREEEADLSDELKGFESTEDLPSPFD
jgi:hypothetical protein